MSYDGENCPLLCEVFVCVSVVCLAVIIRLPGSGLEGGYRGFRGDGWSTAHFMIPLLSVRLTHLNMYSMQ